MVVRSFIDSVVIIKAIVFSFYFSSKKLILAQMFIYYMNKKNRSLDILKCVTQFNIIYDVIFDQSECVLLYVT